MIKAILFDYDDTLVQAHRFVFNTLKETGKRYYKLQIQDSSIKKLYGTPYMHFLRTIFQDMDPPGLIKKKYELVRREFKIELFPDSLSTIQILLKKYNVGIMTSAGRDIVMQDLNRLGFPINSFIYIQTADDTTVHKPNHHVFDHILDVLNKHDIHKNEVIYVGDNINDYYAARDAGLADFYGIVRGFTTKETFEKEGVKLLNSLKDLIRILK